ncbi:hypothetical protein AGR4A_Cc250078 [Agrobacterium tumefaciens str. B6]|uniref:Propionyl-coenzyme A carboxylase alpha polypeptide n=1 Tax=Agrobacterium tumefaciens str. B6 TaxID=1183423 RepID=A0A822UWG6_AGRTU|nr:hypothetical protein B7W89_12660 [Agrobacterium tumefaciens]CVI17374.1 hypothetical protein AGR4A_Cc250078 [Agrobacterium tumefaciens str. B6]
MPPPPSALPGISPTGGEIGKGRLHRSISTDEEGGAPCRESISPPVGEMPGRAEGGMLVQFGR